MGLGLDWDWDWIVFCLKNMSSGSFFLGGFVGHFVVISWGRLVTVFEIVGVLEALWTCLVSWGACVPKRCPNPGQDNMPMVAFGLHFGSLF